jgi:subtilisin
VRRPVQLLVVLILTTLATAPVAHASSKPTSSYVVVLRDGTNVQAKASRATQLGAEVFQQYSHALDGLAIKASPGVLSLIQSDPAVLFVSPNMRATLDDQTLPTGVDRIDGDQSSTRSGDGSGSVPINVAVLDTGIDLTHPDLNVVGGTNCGAGADPSFDDHYGHGTHVAGTIGAEDNGEGVVGVAPGARLWAVRVMSAVGQGSTATALCGVDFVTSTRADSDPTNDIAVASMSIGFSGPKVGDDGNCGLSNHDALHLAICNSTAAGVTYVVAGGNSAMDFRNDTPATYNEVLTVTGIADFNGQPGGGASPTCRTDVDDTYADFSSFATLVSDQAHTIAAPGVCILSTTAPKSLIWGGANAPLYGVLSGTSMATPHVAGTVALCIFSGPCASLSPGQIVSKMVSDAASYNQANPSYGFVGDPQHPVTGKYFGYLIQSGSY